MNKDQFLYQLQQALRPLDPELTKEILADFEEHFANGLQQSRSEEELSKELGDPAQIAKEYKDSIADGQQHQDIRSSWQENWQRPDTMTPEARHQTALQPDSTSWQHGSEPDTASDGSGTKAWTAQDHQNAGQGINEGMLVLVIVLNLFIALPVVLSLISVLFGFWAAAGGIGIAGLALFAVAILEAGIIGLILFLFGLSLVALAVIGLILMVYLTKGFVYLLRQYFIWNRNLVKGGAAI